MDLDRPRLIARRAEHAYVDSPSEAMLGEPEAISESAQFQITKAMHDQVALGRQQALLFRRGELQRQRDHLAAQLRGTSRELARLERRINRSGPA